MRALNGGKLVEVANSLAREKKFGIAVSLYSEAIVSTKTVIDIILYVKMYLDIRFLEEKSL